MSRNYSTVGAIAVASGTITVKSNNNVTQVKFITNTFTDIDIDIQSNSMLTC